MILVTLIMEALPSSETSVLTTSIRSNILDDEILPTDLFGLRSPSDYSFVNGKLKVQKSKATRRCPSASSRNEYQMILRVVKGSAALIVDSLSLV
jgi:hypothetical protein